jgi:hypothetical protein
LLSFGVAINAQKNNKYPKLTAEEVVKKNVESIGTSDAIAAANTRIFMGNGRFTSKIGFVGQLDGTVQMASSGDKFLLALVFNSPEYSYEKFGYDGEDVTVGIPGGVTDVGAFIKSNKNILRKGLFGGSLSSAWPLLDPKSDLKYEYAGIVDVGGKPAYKLKLSSGSVGILTTNLYFDAETFHHVMTDYRMTESAPMGGKIIDSTQTPTYKTLTERFGGYVKAGSLTLPTQYVVEYSITGGNGTVSETFSLNFNEGYFDRTVDTSAFRVS